MTLIRLLTSDATWDKFQADWERQCEEIGDDYENYATYSLAPIKDLSKNKDPNQWAATIEVDGRSTAAFMLILANQKGFDKPVLRIRHIVVCPLLDQGTLSVDTYAETLIELIFESVKLSERDLCAKYLKMHVRSPADLTLLKPLTITLDKQGQFESTELQGSWLTITKR